MTQGKKCFLCNLLEDLEFEEHQDTIKHLAATHDCTQSFKCENCTNNNFHSDLAKSKNSNPIDQPISEDKNLNKNFGEIKKIPKENKKPSQNSDDIVGLSDFGSNRFSGSINVFRKSKIHRKWYNDSDSRIHGNDSNPPPSSENEQNESTPESSES